MGKAVVAWVVGGCVIIACANGAALATAGSIGDRPPAEAAPQSINATPCPKPAAPIAIRSVRLSEDPIRLGSTVSGTVIATCNVAAVTAQVGTFRVSVPKRSPGVFQQTVAVPRLAWPGHFNLIVTAVRTDGFSIKRIIPIVVTW